MHHSGPFVFTKAERLLKRSEYLYVSRFGQKVQNEHFQAIFSPGRYERTRLGVTLTTRVGRAVVRNRIKRYIREFFRLNKHRIAGNWDINIIAKHGAAEITQDMAFKSLQDILNGIEKSKVV